MEVRGQPEGAGSLLLPCMSQRLNLGHQAWYQYLHLLSLIALPKPEHTFINILSQLWATLAYQLIPVLAEGPT